MYNYNYSKQICVYTRSQCYLNNNFQSFIVQSLVILYYCIVIFYIIIANHRALSLYINLLHSFTHPLSHYVIILLAFTMHALSYVIILLTHLP